MELLKVESRNHFKNGPTRRDGRGRIRKAIRVGLKNNTMKTFMLAALAALLFEIQFATAQTPSGNPSQTEVMPHRYLSLGVRASGIQVGDLMGRAVPANRILLSVDPIKFMRIEGQFGMYSKKTEASDNIKIELKDKSSLFGFGLFGMYNKDRGRFYAGPRYGIINYSEEHESGFSSTSVVKSTGKMSVFSFVLGGEYFLARFFSVGAEFSIVSMKDTYNDGEDSSSDEVDKTTMTEGNLVFRFYPF